MNRQQFHAAHNCSIFPMGKFFENNPLPSCTDPTQDCPVSQIHLSASGEPLNVRKNGMQYANLPIDQMTALDRRNNDKFDILGEQMSLQEKVRNTIKFSKKNENQKNN